MRRWIFAALALVALALPAYASGIGLPGFFVGSVGAAPCSASNPCAPNVVTSSPLEVWLEADAGCLNGSGTACANGDSVATWQDQSGNAHNATGAGCTSTPVYNTNVFSNGKSALLFTTASSQCLTDGYNGAAGTIIVVYYSSTTIGQVDSNTSEGVLSGAPQTGVSITAYDIYAETPSNVSSNYFHVRLFTHGTTANSSNYSYFTKPSRVRNLWSIAGMTDDGTTLTAYEGDSVLSTATIPGGATEYTATGQVIGAGDFNSTHGSYFQGYIAEVITYQGKLSANDYASVIAWLQQKYGLGAPSGNYLMMANNQAGGEYFDNNLYLVEGSDGSAFPYALPTNYVPTPIAGQGDIAVALAPLLLHDDEGNAVKYNGKFWASVSRCGFENGVTYPCVVQDILSASDDGTGKPAANWTGGCTVNSDTVGATDGTSSTRGMFDDVFFIDRGNSNATYILFDASNTMSTVTAVKEYAVPITLNSDGSCSVGALVTFTGTQFSANWFTSGEPIYLSGTYYLDWFDVNDQSVVHWSTSTSPFTGYNTGGTLTGPTGSTLEWASWVQSGGNGFLYLDSTNGPKVYVASDGHLGTVSGVTAGTALSFQKAGAQAAFSPQSALVVKLPAISLP